MALVRWDPFAELFRVQDQMNRLFDDSRRRSGPRELAGAWTPAVDIYEDQESFVVKAELPEVDGKDVDIRLDSNTLTIAGERKLEREEDKESYHTVERCHGKFSRSFTLPDTVDQDKVTAEASNGVLRVVLPKKPETKPREIEIKVA